MQIPVQAPILCNTVSSGLTNLYPGLMGGGMVPRIRLGRWLQLVLKYYCIVNRKNPCLALCTDSWKGSPRLQTPVECLLHEKQ